MEQPATSPPESGGGGAPPPGTGAQQPPPRRGRGRPVGAKSAPPGLPPEQAIPPESGASPEEPRKRKHRRAPIDKEAWIKEIKKAHAQIAKWLREPKLELDDNEAAIVGSALEAVFREFNIEITGKPGALTQVAYAALMVYGPRIPTLQEAFARVKQQFTQTKRRGPVTVDGEATAVNGAAAQPAGH